MYFKGNLKEDKFWFNAVPFHWSHLNHSSHIGPFWFLKYSKSFADHVIVSAFLLPGRPPGHCAFYIWLLILNVISSRRPSFSYHLTFEGPLFNDQSPPLGVQSFRVLVINRKSIVHFFVP